MTQINCKSKKLKVRGTGCFDLNDNSFEFTAFNEAPSTQQNVKTCKGGKTFETTSVKKPLKVAHLTCPADSADPYAEYIIQLGRLGIKPKKPVAIPAEQRVVNENGLECWLNEEKNEMTFTGTINLARHPRDWQAETLRLVQLVVRRLPASERFNRIINNIKMEETSSGNTDFSRKH
jgi:hypothetical protein